MVASRLAAWPSVWRYDLLTTQLLWLPRVNSLPIKERERTFNNLRQPIFKKSFGKIVSEIVLGK